MDRIVACLLLEGMQTADAGREYHSHTILVYAFVLKTGVSDCLVGGRQSIHGVKIELTHLAAVEMRGRIISLYLARELRLEFRRVKMSDRRSSALSPLGCLPCAGDIIAKRTERS